MRLEFIIDVPPGCTVSHGLTVTQCMAGNMDWVSPKQPGAKRYRVFIDVPPNDGVDQIIVASAEIPGSFKADGVKDESTGS